MPYLRITCPELTATRRLHIADSLTSAVVDLFHNPKAPISKEELKERVTIHFVPYARGELYIGGNAPEERDGEDVTVELSDWYLTVRQQRKIARDLTPLLAELWYVVPEHRDSINIRFHSYPPTDFAVGGRLLSDRVPRIGQIMKRLIG